MATVTAVGVVSAVVVAAVTTMRIVSVVAAMGVGFVVASADGLRLAGIDVPRQRNGCF
jgi:hypothetical protein